MQKNTNHANGNLVSFFGATTSTCEDIMATYINNLHIELFRGIKSLEIDKLSDVTIFVGDNNTGKTSVLEAIRLFCNPTGYGLMQIARARESLSVTNRIKLDNIDSLKFLFNIDSINGYQSPYYIDISGDIAGVATSIHVEGKIVEQIVDWSEIAKNDPFIRRMVAHSEIEERGETEVFIGSINSYGMQNTLLPMEHSERIEVTNFSRFLNERNSKSILNVKHLRPMDHVMIDPFRGLGSDKILKEKAVDLLKEFDNTIKDIRYIRGERSTLAVIDSNNRDKYLPLSMYGDGIKKALSMLSAIVHAENGVLLIDEFETALHTTAMEKVFKFVLESAQNTQVQLFMTTHSIEAVDKLLACAPDMLEKIQIIRLKKTENETFAKVTPGKIALENRTEYDMELRV